MEASPEGPNRRPRVPTVPTAGVWALWANAVAFVLVAATLWTRGGPDAGRVEMPWEGVAAGQVPIGGGGGLYVVPGQLGQNRYGIFVLDIDRQSLLTYWFDAAGRRLEFISAREIIHDRRLGNFNTMPDPADIRAVADREQERDRQPPPPTPAGEPDPADGSPAD